MKFAVVLDGEVKEIREYPEQPVCKVQNGLPTVRPFFDAEETDTHKHGGYLIENDKVTRQLTARSLEEVKERMKIKMQISKAKYYKVAKEKQLEKDIADATTVEQLVALDFVTGW